MDNKVFSGLIRYASCWEDTENLLRAGEIKGKTCVSVVSGGDNTLSLLTRDPGHIIGFDLNDKQIALFRLKAAAFKTLSYEQLLAFLGIEPCDSRLDIFDSLPLTDEVRKSFLEDPGIIERGVIHAGKFEHYFQLFREKMIPLFSTRERFREFALLDDPEEQKKFFAKYINTARFKVICRIFFGARSMGKHGRDRSFYKYVGSKEKENQGDEILRRFEYGISHTINRTNPYLRYILTSNYKEPALPYYLRRENFEKIRNGLDRIELRRSDFVSLRDIKADFYNLSDIFEYMSEFDFRRNIAVLKKTANPGAAVVYYNMQNRRYISDPAFTLDKELSEALFTQNRSFFYRDLLIYNYG